MVGAPQRQLPNLSQYTFYADGRIYTNFKKRFLRPALFTNGYYVISVVYDDGLRKKELVHRLLAKAFIPNPAGKPHINHKNGVRTDNRLENLEWCTHAENMLHANATGLRRPKRGTRVPQAKLNCEQLREILILLGRGMYHEDIGKRFGVSDSTICEINTGKRYTEEVAAIRKRLSEEGIEAS